MGLAIFDIDGVLVRSSSERAFWRYLFRRGKQGPRQLIAYAVSFSSCLRSAGIHAIKMNKSYLAGLPCPEVESLGEQFIREWAPENWVWSAVERLRDHQARGDVVALLSGTLELLARPLARQLNVRHVFATLLSQRNAVFQSKLPVLHPFAAAKLAIADKLARDLGIGWQDVTAYGDSCHDLPLLEAAGVSVAVRPDRKLRKIALQRGWEILRSGEAGRATPGEKLTPRA